MITNFDKLKFEYPRNIPGSFFNQEHEYFTFDIGLTDDKETMDRYNDIIKDTDFHINAQKVGLDLNSIRNKDGELSFVNLRTKFELFETLIMSDKMLELKMKEAVDKMGNNIELQDENLLMSLSLNNSPVFQEIITKLITKIISFGIPAQNILMASVDTILVDASDGTIFNIQEFIEKVKNGDFTDFDPRDFMNEEDAENGVLRLQFSDLIKGLAKTGHIIKQEINVQIVLNKYFEQTKETCIDYITKMAKVEEKISDYIIKNVMVGLGLEKGKINLESTLSDIQENLFDSQMKSDPSIRFVSDPDASNIIDIIIQSDECIMKQELKDVVDTVGFSYITKQLAIGSTLLIRGIYVPNRINKHNPFETIDVTNFSKQGYFYIILERHPGNGQVLRKIFNGKYHGIAKTVSDFIVKNEAVLLKSV